MAIPVLSDLTGQATDAELAAHEADTTVIHGVDDTSKLSRVVVHGATAATARPSGFAVILWIGSVTPTNGVSGDLFLNTA